MLLKNGKHDLTLVGLPISMQDLYLVRISNENAQQPEHHKFDQSLLQPDVALFPLHEHSPVPDTVNNRDGEYKLCKGKVRRHHEADKREQLEATRVQIRIHFLGFCYWRIAHSKLYLLHHVQEVENYLNVAVCLVFPQFNQQSDYHKCGENKEVQVQGKLGVFLLVIDMERYAFDCLQKLQDVC